MKKIFLFVAALTLSLTSCSSDDNSGGNGGNGGNGENDNSVLKVTIDGVAKTFNSIVVNEDTETYDGETYTDLTVTATIDGNTDEIIVFSLEKGAVGANVVYYSYYNASTGGVFVIQTNSNNKLKGTFSGAYSIWNNETQEEEYIQLTNGSFDISY